MKVIFGTTNKRKIEDLLNIITNNNLDIEVLTLEDINWDEGEIEENGKSLEENSLIKAEAIYNFCLNHNLSYPIITDDSGLFVESLNGEPGIYTARYADEERKKDPNAPKHECVNKLLRNLKGNSNREAEYRCVVTLMYPNHEYIQQTAITKGTIAEEIVEPIKKPYFYSVFKLENSSKKFNHLSSEELKNTYRYVALDKIVKLLMKKDKTLVKK